MIISSVFGRKNLHWILFFAGIYLALLYFSFRYDWLISQKYPLDYDGFYYLQEFKSRLETGDSYYNSKNPYFLLMTWVGELFHFGPMQIFNVSVSASYLLFCLAIFFLCFRRDNPGFSALILALLARSDAIFYLFYGFLKQGMASAFFAWGLFLLFKKSEDKKSVVVTIFLFVLASCMHLFALALSMLVLLALLRRGPAQNFIYIPTCLLLCAGFCGIALYFNKDFSSEISWSGVFPWLGTAKRGWITAYEQNEYPLYFCLAPIFILSSFRRPFQLSIFFFSVFLLLTLPIWREGSTAWFRFMISSPILWYLGFAVFLNQKIQILRELERVIICLVFLSLSSLLLRAESISQTERKLGPAMRYEILEESAPQLKQWLPANAFIQAPHGIQFRIHYFLGIRAAKELPKNSKNFRLYKLAQQPGGTEQCLTLGQIITNESTDCVVLFGETLPAWFLYSLPETVDSKK